MACLVKYCMGSDTPTLGLCSSHVKVWHKASEPVGDALDAWLKNQSDLELDVCPTPDDLALAICTMLGEVLGITKRTLRAPVILEPSAGDGAFVCAARKVWPPSHITAIEIRSECRTALAHASADRIITGQDLLHFAQVDDAGAFGVEDPDLVIGNPPFAKAEKHIRHLLNNMKEGAYLAFLLRTGFYESFERLPFWREFPEKFFAPIVPRPSFKLNGQGKKGTDSQSYGLFVWQKGWAGTSTRLPHIVWREETKTRGRSKKVNVPVVEAPELEAAPIEAPELE